MSIDPQGEDLFHLYTPRANPVAMVSIPHSGLVIPSDFDEFIIKDKTILDKDVDTHVDKLVDIEKLRDNGVIVLVSNIHRTCCDLNRSQDKTILAWEDNSQGEKIVLNRPDDKTKNYLLQKYYVPYYQVLKSSLEQLMGLYETPSFIDLHSMPSEATEYHMKQNPNQKRDRPQFCLSDQFGKTCTAEYISFIQKSFEKRNYEALINDPYKGGHITDYVGDFKVNNIQIEIKRALYMNETTRELNSEKQAPLKTNLTDILLETFEHFS